MFWYDHDLTTWGWIGMTLAMVAFWVLIIGALVWLVRGVGRDEREVSQHRSEPEQVLAERFARGEIDEAEYDDRLATLRGRRSVVRS